MFAVATRDVRCTSSTSDVVSCLASSASRPLEASKLAVGYDRFTSTRDVASNVSTAQIRHVFVEVVLVESVGVFRLRV
jgi:hypothetical protein